MRLLNSKFLNKMVVNALLIGSVLTVMTPSHAELIEDSKTVVRFSASYAHWISPPNFSGIFGNGGDIEFSARLLVDKTGRIHNIAINSRDRLTVSSRRQIVSRIKKGETSAFYEKGRRSTRRNNSTYRHRSV